MATVAPLTVDNGSQITISGNHPSIVDNGANGSIVAISSTVDNGDPLSTMDPLSPLDRHCRPWRSIGAICNNISIDAHDDLMTTMVIHCRQWCQWIHCRHWLHCQGRSQDVSLRGVSVRAKRTLLRKDVCGRAKVFRYARRPSAGENFLGLTACKTSRCNLVIEISFVPSSQSTFNFSVLRGTQVDFFLFNLFRPVGKPDFFENYSF